MHRRSPNNPLRLWLLPVLRSRALQSQSRTAFQTCHRSRENGGIVRPRRSCGFGSEKSAPRLNIPQAVKNRVANVCCRLAALRLFALCAFRITAVSKLNCHSLDPAARPAMEPGYSSTDSARRSPRSARTPDRHRRTAAHLTAFAKLMAGSLRSLRIFVGGSPPSIIVIGLHDRSESRWPQV